ncbi:MAG: SPW repeat protein [Bryobacteraceae bacterium]
MVPNQVDHSSNDSIKMASGLTLLVSLWFFVSPWVYGAYHMANAWNSWIIGGVLAIVAAICLSSSPRNAANLSWLSVVLSVWVFFSPWIFGYSAEKGRFINSLCVGAVAFVLSMMASMMGSRVMGSRNSSGTTVPHRM